MPVEALYFFAHCFLRVNSASYHFFLFIVYWTSVEHAAVYIYMIIERKIDSDSLSESQFFLSLITTDVIRKWNVRCSLNRFCEALPLHTTSTIVS